MQVFAATVDSSYFLTVAVETSASWVSQESFFFLEERGGTVFLFIIIIIFSLTYVFFLFVRVCTLTMVILIIDSCNCFCYCYFQLYFCVVVKKIFKMKKIDLKKIEKQVVDREQLTNLFPLRDTSISKKIIYCLFDEVILGFE